MPNSTSNYFKSVPNGIKNGVADILSNSDFISRTIGMDNSYEDLMYIVQILGREPVSLLGKDYPFIFDHVRRNYQQGTWTPSYMYGGGEYGCPKFTFYKEKPTVRFADPYFDIQNLKAAWFPDIKLNETKRSTTGIYYAESNDNEVKNKTITNVEANNGVANGQVASSFNNLSSCDLIKKTNDNFNAGKYRTLVARFHTNSDDSRVQNDPTQTANSDLYGMSHGRNLLKKDHAGKTTNGYSNPYCRVWTYHHQYNQMLRAIRPFEDAPTAKALEEAEFGGSPKGGFRTLSSDNYHFDGGSERLDKHGVLNYENGFVNIAPTAKIKDYFEHKENDKDRRSISTKRCMFSIENLAWRDAKNKMDEFEAYGLSAEQKGPLGGRIMWFPPYDLNFNEDVRVKWNSNEFIGRGENIYTYTNTERTGNLSFTLLIDHPSILDYWTGHERNGMKNGGETLLPGNEGGIDEPNNQENTLLRFFAGCDILTAKPQTYWSRHKTPETMKDQPGGEPPKPENPNPVKPDEIKLKGKQVMCCVLYYPNNYSGVNDKVGSYVSAVNYLMNGVGTQKYIYEDDEEGVSYLRDIPTAISSDSKGKGYEVGNSITIETTPITGGVTNRQKTYTEDKRYEYITDKSGSSKTSVTLKGKKYYLGKIVGSKAKSYEQASSKLWHQRRWYYRVDEGVEYKKNNGKIDTYENDNLTKAESYLDTQCFNLNRQGYTAATSSSSLLVNKIKEDTTDENLHLIPFSDMFYALERDNQVINAVDMNNVRYVEEIMKHKENGIKISKVTFIGCASQAGHIDGNEKLARNRALTFKEWAAKNNFPISGDEDDNQDGTILTYTISAVNNGYANSLDAKLHRCSMIKVEYEYEKTEPAQATDSGDKTEKVSKGNTKQQELLKVNLERMSENGRNELSLSLENQLRAKYGIPPVQNNNRWNNSTDLESTDFMDSIYNTGQMTSSTIKRYDNEGEFFQLLEKNAPFMHHLISEKIKYFDPAYHSISPEGFNARLTFLQQCCRQGPTVGNSDYEAKTAYNLAFGRPPVCVLRLGDFYYTKILINSMNIQYENAQWDLNPEGIGVMPMFAKVSIQFTFLGGSDLAGPISRLQNAVSFNYYANTSVYDNRAERVQYSDNGDGREIKYKPFVYPNEHGGRNRIVSTEYEGKEITFQVNRDGIILEDL